MEQSETAMGLARLLYDTLNTAESLYDMLWTETATDENTVIADLLPRDVVDACIAVGQLLVGDHMYPARGTLNDALRDA